MILADVGVWLAAVWGRHIHHPDVARWFDDQTDEIAFCRVTQTGLLRLLSNPAVLGDDVVTRRDAWAVFDELHRDDRVVWAAEPAGLSAVWRAVSARDDGGHRMWTEDYLAAFAQTSGSVLVTLDRRMEARYPSVHVEPVI